MISVLIGLAVWAGVLAVFLVGFWAYGVIADRRHARHMVQKFDLFVASLEHFRDRA